MTSFSIDNQEHELNKVIGDFDASIKKTKLYFGLVGYKIAMPFILGKFSIRLRFQRADLNRTVKSLLVDLEKFEERDKMELELDFLHMYEDYSDTVLPLAKSLQKKSNKSFFLNLVINQIEKLHAELKYSSEKITSLVYPNTIDPATNTELFKELIDCYKSVDLSDWKQEDRVKNNSKVAVKHGGL
ncbi:hypothetical protein [Pedobacter borealis]|uniref:hypothetical protein n=1 Tax=Pedobacter borealis TaxID=475254 RepID=UPI00049352AC|nr:hypothetical protein [Pedobacter borealis]